MEHSAQVEIPLLSLLPFVLMLVSIAVLPLFWNHFWEKNKNKLYVAIVLSIPVVIYLLTNNFSHQLIHTMLFDYVPFLIFKDNSAYDAQQPVRLLRQMLIRPQYALKQIEKKANNHKK